MFKFIIGVTCTTFVVSTMALAQQPKNCAGLSELKLPGVNIKINKAAMVPTVQSLPEVAHNPRPYNGPLPAYCRVEGVVNPRTTADGEKYGIGFALALPENWNSDFEMEGGGGSNGIIYEPYGTMTAGDVPGLARGFAVATNDTGHAAKVQMGFDFSFRKDQQATLDFDYLANAEMAGVAKQIIAAYYGKPAAFSYFVGCSTGGREGMILSQRWPEVFNGIVSGDPAMRTGFSNIAIGPWTAVNYNQIAPKDDSGKPMLADAITDSDRKLVIDALLKDCDSLDGVADGMISNPLACQFDPAVLACKQGQAAPCLPAEKVTAIKKVFGGPKDSHGNQVYSPFLYDTGVAGPFGGLLHPGRSLFGPPSTSMTLDVDALADKAAQPLTDSLFTNLGTFQARGGKLIFYHGDSDPLFSPLDTLSYYREMAAANGGLDKTLLWSQFYFVPGMAHCQGGATALDNFDLLTAIVNWTEKGQAPASVNSTGKSFPGRSRPLCAYPKHAQYKGSGNSEDAQNFVCE